MDSYERSFPRSENGPHPDPLPEGEGITSVHKNRYEWPIE
jgi:hypothetical protein